MEKIYNEHANTVYKFLYTKTQNSDWAEELTQETFYRAIKSIKTYDGSCKISTWLCQIAKHVWMQELEKKSKYKTENISDDMVSSEDSIEDKLVQAEHKIQLIKALHFIKEPAREVMYLRLLGDLSFKEIGDILGKSETWSRVTFFRNKCEIMKGDYYE
ncbi:sigma-70 family RNA polymerase sigma factor [Sedimentibacter sp.]|uniref:RNA polymerase sigma factor n=1 Tax=Sedimentibacter sp. TaxID=1960295 RepID=UPI0028B0A4F2|nr:sigma-70 family RNA polymerase sigma factor [Sedimentibacter sp.]